MAGPLVDSCLHAPLMDFRVFIWLKQPKVPLAYKS